MGGGNQPSPPPAPAPGPSAIETSAQAIQAQIDALPKILEAQQQYGGQFSEEQLKSLQQYGPEFAQAALDLQKKFAPQFADVERSLSPELAGAQRTLAGFLGGSDEAEYEGLRPGLLEDVRGAQSQRGLGAISPLGSIDESVQLQRLKQSLKDRRLNVALSTAGRVPISSFPNVQGQTGTGQLVQNVNPESIFGYQQGLNNFNASIFGTQGNIYSSQLSNPQPSILGSIAGTAGGMALGSFTGGLGYTAGQNLGSTWFAPKPCWVAATVFDGWEDERTHNARKFILNDAPIWFRKLYIKYGESFARFIENRTFIKNLIRPIFEWFAKKGAI